jgi:hypothetical protein
LILDAVWRNPTVLYRPFKGLEFPRIPGVASWEIVLTDLRDPALYIAEVIGLVVSVTLLIGTREHMTGFMRAELLPSLEPKKTSTGQLSG